MHTRHLTVPNRRITPSETRITPSANPGYGAALLLWEGACPRALTGAPTTESPGNGAALLLWEPRAFTGAFRRMESPQALPSHAAHQAFSKEVHA